MSGARTQTDVLAETIDVAGLDVLDVGCGAGALVRWLRERGARPVGAECGDVMRQRAIAADPEHPDAYVDAPGEDLPFADASFDLVIFVYSLHHVPEHAMPDALSEARRVLRPGGTLYVVEPDPDAADDIVAMPVVDERLERAAAQRALDGVAGFGPIARSEFVGEAVYDDFDTWVEVLVGIVPARAERVVELGDDLRDRFHRMAEPHPAGFAFEQRNLLAVLTAT
ncbi:MAG: class I SAM-dependent methyltransferase [Ilumatobacter sp.]|uniref:class I SAM-dependent methyltransferase n=1 Tax=Ilumatobacter sp. TaxID=1967498 RepID=UPI0026366C74|nr:class I SAM-dependent methyltransferase [Ilumatobacter sp.]MDJ0768929.1 class I SAM-dependent methyltransferase [Ilumatobacter sp.]